MIFKVLPCSAPATSGLRTLHQSNAAALLLLPTAPALGNPALPCSSPGKYLTDHLFDRHFLDIDVCHRQLIQQRLAGRNDAIPLYLQPDRGSALFDHFPVAIELRGGVIARILHGDYFKICETVEHITECSVEEDFAAMNDDHAPAELANIGHVMAG